MTIRIALGALLLGLGLVSGAHAGKSGPAAQMSLVEISPAPGSAVGPDTVVMATLNYEIYRFQGPYTVMAQFDTLEPGKTSATFEDGGRAIVPVTAPSGALVVEVPLKLVWDKAGIRKPLRLKFVLREGGVAEGGTVLAQAGAIEYR